MKNLIFFTACMASLSLFTLSAEDLEEKHESKTVQTSARISEAFGHLIGKNIESMGMQLDLAAVIKGLNDSIAGKDSPMTEMECIQALTDAQEKAFQEKASENLALAEAFLKKNKTEQGVISNEDGHVQYKIEKEGSGEALPATSCPLVLYTGKFLDGSVFTTSSEPEPLPLDEVIPGIKEGVAGMKEGEKRVIFIHPDHAYGTSGGLPPNSLLEFNIEVVKNEAPLESEHTSSHKQDSSEIALPDVSFEHVR